MNAKQANAISLPEILKKLGYPPQKEHGRDAFYSSPFRNERTPSFHVNVADNLWYDFGAARGGDVVDFACLYLESRSLGHRVEDALRFLGDMVAFALTPCTIKAKVRDNTPVLDIETVRPLQHATLLRYLIEDRCIPLDLARTYLVEVVVYNRNTGKIFHTIGMENDDGGYELRNAAFKGCAGHKDVTVLRGAAYPPREVHVFEGFMDMLSALADQEIGAFPGDMIVLHSLSCLSQALPYIENYESYKRLFSWLDNDLAGENATQVLRQVVQRQSHLDVCAMNPTYAPFKDVNEYRVMRLKPPAPKSPSA